MRFLQLSEKAKKLMGQQGLEIPGNRGGPDHEYWKHKIAERYKEKGYRVEFEKEINGHYVDLLATKENEAIAVEVETGKSDAIENVRSDLKSGFKVTCFVLSEKLIGQLTKIFNKEIADEVLKVMGPSRLEYFSN